MKIKFTLTRSGSQPLDMQATVDSTTTVGDLADHLLRADPARQHEQALDGTTLAVVGADQRSLNPRLRLVDSPVRSGSVVALAGVGGGYADPAVDNAAVVEVVAGPDTGRSFPVPWGTSVIGREPACEVRLSDPMVSRRHAQLNITEVAELIDLGSANGMQLGGSVVSRSVLRPGDRVQLGDTELTVRVLHGASVRRAGTAAVGFVRSPRLAPRYEGVELTAPEPPQRPTRQRFPVIPLIAPVLMGAMLFLVTKSVVSLLFVALSPLMLIGYALETALAGRSAFRAAVRQFRSDVDGLVSEATEANRREVAGRGREHPTLAECVDAIRRGDRLLWTRRPAEHGFLELRLGAGSLPARNRIELPDPRRLPRDLYAELVAATKDFAEVAGVPVVAAPAEHGALGVAGSRPAALALARALLVQLAGLHSPAEVVLAAFASTPTAPDWDWLKWLPHTGSTHSPVDVRHLVVDTAASGALAAELEDLLHRRAAGECAVTPSVFVLIEDDAAVDRSRLVDLAERGWRHGIHVLWLAGDVSLLPAACRTFVMVEPAGASATTGFVHTGESVAPVAIDLLDLRDATELARRLAPLVDTGAKINDDVDLPRSIPLVSVVEPAMTPTAEAVLERWQENRSILAGPYAPDRPVKQVGTLRAVVGRSAAGAHALDLRTDGPHALVGGTTGSGKSELLQSWILAMAAAHSPHRLTFLLVDYKGGSAFREFEKLPHTVGTVTDLNPHLVRRALVSLSAELRHREELFATHRVKDLAEFEKQGHTNVPPSLVIVVDEFAALVKELPEFVDGVVNVAQRGRSLGVHLILATQRPAGVIKDNLRANTNLRLALRTADDADSVDVLGSPAAAFFDPELPGRAVSKTGPGRLVTFQAGYAGGWTPDGPTPPEILVEELRFGGGPVWELTTPDEAPLDLGPTDITRMVQAVRAACVQARIAKPRKPWQAELLAHYDLMELGASDSDQELVFGVRDDPEHQSQPMVAFRPDIDGNLVVYGTGGTGKSTLLRTIALAAGHTKAGGPCHVYGIEFGARGLAMIEDLPHVGSVVAGTDHERVGRLLGMLRQLVDNRAVRYSASNVGTISEYRALPGAPRDPRILVLLDGVGAFWKAYETTRWWDVLVGIANDGRPVGVHLLLSADRPAALPSSLASAVQTRIALRLADEREYGGLGLPTDVLAPSSPPGRGLLRGAEIQVAMLGPQPDVSAQAALTTQIAAVMIQRGVRPAPPIQRLPEHVPLDELPVAADGCPAFAISSTTLSPIGFEPAGTFLVTGPPATGRTTTLHALAAALRRFDPKARLHYLGARRSELAGLELWDSSDTGEAGVAEQAKLLIDRLTAEPREHPVAVVVEHLTEFVSTAADAPLQELARFCVHEGLLFIADGEGIAFRGNHGLAALAKASRTGLALSPEQGDEEAFRTQFPTRLNRADFPPGRALLVLRGKTTVVQVAYPAG